MVKTCVEIKFYGAFVLNHRVVLHAIDATPARLHGDAGSSPLDRARTAASSPRNDLVKNCRVHLTHWLISTQVKTPWRSLLVNCGFVAIQSCAHVFLAAPSFCETMRRRALPGDDKWRTFNSKSSGRFGC